MKTILVHIYSGSWLHFDVIDSFSAAVNRATLSPLRVILLGILWIRMLCTRYDQWPKTRKICLCLRNHLIIKLVHRHQSRRQRSFTYQDNCTFSPMLKTGEWMAPRVHTANGQRRALWCTPLSVGIHTYTIQLQQCLFPGYSNSNLVCWNILDRAGTEPVSGFYGIRIPYWQFELAAQHCWELSNFP